jgi:uncharacterized OsmC-like protein
MGSKTNSVNLVDTLHVTMTLTGNVDNEYAGKVIRDIMTRRCPVAATFGERSYLTWEHILYPALTVGLYIQNHLFLSVA